MTDPKQNLSDALEARTRASLALQEANCDLARAIRLAQSQGLKGQALADELRMTRANVSYLVTKYG